MGDWLVYDERPTVTQLQERQWLLACKTQPHEVAMTTDRNYGSAELTELNPLLTLLPIVLMATMHSTAMSSASIPYSINAAPSSSFRKLRVTASSHVIVLVPRRGGKLDRASVRSELTELRR